MALETSSSVLLERWRIPGEPLQLVGGLDERRRQLPGLAGSHPAPIVPPVLDDLNPRGQCAAGILLTRNVSRTTSVPSMVRVMRPPSSYQAPARCALAGAAIWARVVCRWLRQSGLRVVQGIAHRSGRNRRLAGSAGGRGQRHHRPSGERRIVELDCSRDRRRRDIEHHRRVDTQPGVEFLHPTLVAQRAR